MTTADFPETVHDFGEDVADGIQYHTAAMENVMRAEMAAVQTQLQRTLLLGYYANAETLTGDKTLTDADDPVQVLDPGGANRDITLAPEANTNHGTVFVNAADTDEDLVIKNDGGDTIVTVGQGEARLVLPNGGAWYTLSAGSGAALTVEEEDGTPTVSNVDTIKFTNGTVTDNEDGSVSVSTGGGGGASSDGWNADSNTWTYASVDDPTGVITIAGVDATAYLSVGMRIKLTNGGNTIYGIITKISYSSPNTTVTFLHEIDPTDSQALYLLANSAITSPCYSTNKVPFGFPSEPTKWTVKATDTTGRAQTNPNSSEWYNLGSLSLSVPIGVWKLGYSVMLSTYELNTRVSMKTTLSTANNSESDAGFTNFYQMYCSTALGNMSIKEKDLSITSKTSYYLNSCVVGSGVDGLYNNNADSTAVIKAVCAYL